MVTIFKPLRFESFSQGSYSFPAFTWISDAIMKVVKILGIAGSLRKGSFNKSILREALALLPENVELEIFDIEGTPSFNQDMINSPPELSRI